MSILIQLMTKDMFTVQEPSIRVNEAYDIFTVLIISDISKLAFVMFQEVLDKEFCNIFLKI